MLCEAVRLTGSWCSVPLRGVGLGLVCSRNHFFMDQAVRRCGKGESLKFGLLLKLQRRGQKCLRPLVKERHKRGPVILKLAINI